MEHGERLPPTATPPVHTTPLTNFGRVADKYDLIILNIFGYLSVFVLFRVHIGPLVMDRYMDLVCPAAILVGFLATAPWGRRSW